MWWNGCLCSDGGTIVKLKASNIHMQLKIHMSYGCVEIGSNISHRLFEMNHIRIVWIIQKYPQFGYIAIPWGCLRNSTQAKSISPAKSWTLCCGCCCCCCCYELRVSPSFSTSSSVSFLSSFFFFFFLSANFSRNHPTTQQYINQYFQYASIRIFFLLYSISVRKSSTDYLNNLFAMLVRSKCKRDFTMNKIQFDN